MWIYIILYKNILLCLSNLWYLIFLIILSEVGFSNVYTALLLLYSILSLSYLLSLGLYPIDWDSLNVLPRVA